MEVDQPIRARTHGEVLAYTDGWVACLEMVGSHGLLDAKREMLIMALSAKRITPEKYDELMKQL